MSTKIESQSKVSSSSSQSESANGVTQTIGGKTDGEASPYRHFGYQGPDKVFRFDDLRPQVRNINDESDLKTMPLISTGAKGEQRPDPSFLANEKGFATRNTLVTTTEGVKTVLELLGRPFTAVVNGQPRECKEGFFFAGEQRVIEVSTNSGYKVKLADCHYVMDYEGEWVSTRTLDVGRMVKMHNHLSQSSSFDKERGGEGTLGDGVRAYSECAARDGRVSPSHERKSVAYQKGFLRECVANRVERVVYRSDRRYALEFENREEDARVVHRMLLRIGVMSKLSTVTPERCVIYLNSFAFSVFCRLCKVFVVMSSGRNRLELEEEVCKYVEKSKEREEEEKEVCCFVYIDNDPLFETKINLEEATVAEYWDTVSGVADAGVESTYGCVLEGRGGGVLDCNGFCVKDSSLGGVGPRLEPKLCNNDNKNCVTGDTWVTTINGPRLVSEIAGQKVRLLIEGSAFSTTEKGFFCVGKRKVLQVQTLHGYNVRLTEDQKLLTVLTEYDNVDAEGRRLGWTVVKDKNVRWMEARDLAFGDEVVMMNQTGLRWTGTKDFEDGVEDGKADKPLTKEDEETTSYRYQRGYLKGVLSKHEDVAKQEGANLVVETDWFEQLQRLFYRFGVLSMITPRSKTGGMAHCYEDIEEGKFVLLIHAVSVKRLLDAVDNDRIGSRGERFEEFVTRVDSVVQQTQEEDVYDVEVPVINAFDGNGFYLHE